VAKRECQIFLNLGKKNRAIADPVRIDNFLINKKFVKVSGEGRNLQDEKTDELLINLYVCNMRFI